MSTRHVWTIGLVSTVALLLYFHASLLPFPAKPVDVHSSGPSNSTLGFGSIFVLTNDEGSWRMQGLRLAAETYGLALTVPQLDSPNETNVTELYDGQTTKDHTKGTIRASLQHNKILRMFLATDQETALILEDDADFSIHIKAQLERVGLVMNSLSEPAMQQRTPYSHDESWDVLWLGHCGVPPEHDESSVHPYEDSNAIPFEQAGCGLNEYYAQMAQQHATPRIIEQTAPMCTYAYAVTREAAKIILESFAREHRAVAFDIFLYEWCRWHPLRCSAPVPELFHHQEVSGQRTILQEGEVGVVQDLDWYMGKHKHTWNVLWSARCNSALTGEKVGDKWQCLPDK